MRHDNCYIMEWWKQLLTEIFIFTKDDIHLISAKNGTTTTIGAVSGAVYEGGHQLIDAQMKFSQLTWDSILFIIISAFIGLLVTFLGRKLITAIWDHLILPPMKRLIDKIKKKLKKRK